MAELGRRQPARRRTYRHGDLRRALIDAGLELAREGGPDAVVLREVTRRVGVVPNAAYRHFADHRALLQAVSRAALGRAALAMEEEIAAVPSFGDVRTIARARVRAIGSGYLRFAAAEPGWFRTAFTVGGDLARVGDRDGAGESGLTPFQLLGRALDDLQAAGLLLPERRDGAGFAAWSAVHGLAMLILEGPLQVLDPAARRAAARRVLEMVEGGL
ncbi:MAG: TetR/AcrR family transcriptional regulator [Candidatus Dormiibacterota bacterium]